ncbi:MAG: dihydropteroate synthase [Deltaproteobacteria bacterium]|nr:dihydropteroate synthase [Deltaproteobacteria bacterium]
MKKHTLAVSGWSLELGEKARIMGIVNVTPDSFSDGGHFFDHRKAMEHGLELAEAGADILDVGGESTRPFSDPVTVEEEMRRVIPVIEALRKKTGLPISVDTRRSATARAALSAGATIINDVSALSDDPAMAALVAERGAAVILMHMLGSPKTMQQDPQYSDVVKEVRDYLEARVKFAVSAGIPKERIVIDPGIGFGKTIEHNLALIRNIPAFDSLGVPVLIGHSRKAFIRRLLAADLGREADRGEIETGTQAVTAMCAASGAHIIRVHDVKAARAAIILARAIRPA